VIRCLRMSRLSRSALVKFVADADFDVAAEGVGDSAELGRLLAVAPQRFAMQMPCVLIRLE
jgi:hypothetical protein